jgi:ABC-type cobalamin transport system ATPase subunit
MLAPGSLIGRVPGPGALALSGQTALSAASLRVEMETANHQAHEAQQEIRSWKSRLARTLGEEVADRHPEHSVSSATITDLTAQVAHLLGAQDDLHRQLRDPRKSSKRRDA